MTVNNDPIQNSIRQLETLLFHDDILNESDSHPLFILRDRLQEMDMKSQLTTMDEKQKAISIVNYFEINCFFQFIQRYSSIIPSSILKALFDTIRFQLNITMKLNPSITDHYFHLSLNYLTADSTVDYLTDKKEIQTTIDEYFLSLFSSIGSCSVYIKTSSSYSICVSHKNIPEFFQLNSSTEHLLEGIIIYLNKYFLDNHQQYESHISVLKWLLNLTDIYGFVPYFVKTGYPNTVLQWMTIKRDQAAHISVKAWFLTINLLQNLARHWMGVKALNKLKAIDILKQWKDQYICESSSIQYNENDKDIIIGYYLVYAILLEPKELKKENISNIQTVLDYILERTIEAFHSPELYFGAYNICEYLNGLAKFVVNDKCLNYIISRDHILDLFMDKFLLFNTNFESTDLNTIICSSLYTIFWSISFQGEYHSKLKSNDKFIQFVEQISKKESDDEYLVMMRRAAKGILFNLDLIQMDIHPIEENNDTKIKVMVSYAHKDATFCRKIVKNLQENLQENLQGEIWVDFNKLSAPYEDDWEEIGKAITQCDVILMIVTENYCSSKSCRREVIHADKRNKRMIPIYQGKDYKPEDWFEIRIGSATWVRFGDKKCDEEVMTHLFGLINIQDKVKRNNNNESIPSHKPQTNTSVIVDRIAVGTSLSVRSNSVVEIVDVHLSSNSNASPVISTSPIEQWTGEEVQQWLHLPPSVLRLSSGRALMTYMNLLSHEDAQYDEYEHRVRDHGVSREVFANLIASFSSIRSLHHMETISSRFPEQWTHEEVKNWFRQNHLSDYLWNTFKFVDGSQLVTYAKLILDSPSRINDEYDRLQHQIGKDLFHLDEYSRFLSSLEKLPSQSKSKEEPSACIIL